MIAHRAFFEALQHGDERQRDWQATSAGLVVLRYLDSWTTQVWRGSQLRAERLGIGRMLRTLPEGDAEGAILAGVVAATAASGNRLTVRTKVVEGLLAYGHALRARAAWAIAVDVYLSAWALAVDTPMLRPGLAAAALLNVGVCLRLLGELADASTAYRGALTLAEGESDADARQEITLRARLGEALVTLDRGNLPKAERLLDEVLAEAAAPHLKDVRARASHDRAVVAWRRGHHDDAAAWAQQAWSLTTDPLQREQLVMDLALLLLTAGYRSSAREAYTLLYETARGPWTRWTAAVNLIEIETLERDEIGFARWVAAIAAVEPALPASLRAEYHYLVGLGHFRFGRPDLALIELERAVQIAAQRQLGELLIRTEAARDAVAAGRTALDPPPATSPSEAARALTTTFQTARGTAEFSPRR
jgi:tetratricopeptide (TPR) repeat protein